MIDRVNGDIAKKYNSIGTYFFRLRKSIFSKFANGRFPVVAAHIVPFDSVGVKIVQHTDANLIAVPIVWLGLWRWFFAAKELHFPVKKLNSNA